jgi:hypothetical protein
MQTKNSGRNSSRFHPYPSILQSILFVHDTCIYAIWKQDCCVLCKLQCKLTAVNSRCEHCNIKTNKGKQRQSTSTSPEDLRVPDNVLQLQRLDIPVCNVMCLGVTFNRMMTQRHHNERTVAKALRTHTRRYSLFKRGYLSTNMKLMIYKAWLGQLWLMPVPPRSMWQTVTSWNCRNCRTEHSVILEILTSAHQSTNCMQLSKSLMYMTT